MKKLTNKTVLITGGASGIGKIMVRLMLERQASVIVWDINSSDNDLLLKEFGCLGKIACYVVDVTDSTQIESAAKRVKSDHGIVDLLINNAGIIVGKFFQEHSKTEIQKTMDINAMAPMYITHLFLQNMIDQKSGHICNIASSAATLSNPKMSVYVASKWALMGWSDSLRLEMKRLKTNVNVTTIAPYYINTGMFDGIKSTIPILDPEKTSLKIIKAIEHNRILVSIPGWTYRFTRFGQALLPIPWLDWFMDKIMGVYDTMTHFEGRKT